MTAYKTAGGHRAHLPDPYLDPPRVENWWFSGGDAPRGWYVATRCGRVLRHARPARIDDELCQMCASQSRQAVRAQIATQGRT